MVRDGSRQQGRDPPPVASSSSKHTTSANSHAADEERLEVRPGDLLANEAAPRELPESRHGYGCVLSTLSVGWGVVRGWGWVVRGVG